MKVLILSPIKEVITDSFKMKLKGLNVQYIEKSEKLDKVYELQNNEEKLLVIDPDFTYNLSREVLEKIPNVKCIILTTTAFSWIDLDYCNEQNIIVCNTPYFSSEAVAEWAFMSSLALARKVPLVIKMGLNMIITILG
ncbi:MAG: hypothetical protein Q9M91_02240 [Candidatus Dojkabacteria bacterium]|nr:hypothetical protein [Candidatus Dojkabacteria bacterium]